MHLFTFPVDSLRIMWTHPAQSATARGVQLEIAVHGTLSVSLCRAFSTPVHVCQPESIDICGVSHFVFCNAFCG